MPSFPSMLEIPISADTLGWSWYQIQTPTHPSKDFWIGTDTQGNRWLTKLRGSFYAYREIVFARIVQRLGWSCQSTMFVRLDEESARTLGRKAGEVHAAHWYMSQHAGTRCGEDCSMVEVFGRQVESINDLNVAGISHLLDWPKSELAAYIFGGNEPPGRLFTTAHEFVVIDSEQMFSTDPCPFDDSPWLKNSDGTMFPGGMELAAEVCAEIASLPGSFLSEALAKPPGLSVKLSWPIKPKLVASMMFAATYAQRCTGA